MKNIPQLDGLRAVAVLMVFANHCLGAPGLWAGVDLFFILSGFLITGILLRDVEKMSFGQVLARFYTRRAERILPPYFVVMALAAFTLSVPWHSVWYYYAFFLQNVPVARNLSVPAPLIPLWSLGVEQQFYLVWPVFVFFWPRKWLTNIMLALILLSPIVRALATPFTSSAQAAYSMTFFRLDALATGALVVLAVPTWDKATAIRWARVAFVAGIVLTVAFGVLDHRHFNRMSNSMEFNALQYTFNVMSMGGLFVWTLLSEGALKVALSWRPLRALGRISYMFYLMQMFLVVWLERYVHGLVLAALVFVGCAVVGTVSWNFLESPILSLSAGHRRKTATAPLPAAVE